MGQRLLQLCWSSVLTAVLAKSSANCVLVVQDAVVRPASIRKQPFTVTRSLSGVANMRVRIQLHLTDAINEAYRMQSFVHIMPTSAAPSQSIAIQQTYAFTTQTVVYSPAASTDLPSSISGLLEHNIQPSAKRHKSSSTAC